ncbi:MAG: T9SS type A sorting domain-containing protein [Ignavibacteriaceae bacterium]|nr:T9SS type A sorting domain-containing protein [Ignavibacteriaceae bacterium]
MDPLAGKPSKPQDLTITVYNTGSNSHPKLNWIAAGETDVQSANPGVLIDRKINNGSWTQIATLSGTAAQYIDYGINYAGSGYNTAYYRIRFKDTQNKISIYSDIKSIQYGDAWKIGTEQENSITDYKLQQNYPNPFNPTTSISFSIPKNGFVTLKVYDILGKEVAELVNEIKEAGNYSVTFNASELPSGIYFYTLTSGNFTATKKLILLK